MFVVGCIMICSIQWHPKAPELISTTRDGNVLVWRVQEQENFAAYAGGFEEIPENSVYEEREDEFDIEDEDSIARRKDLEEETEVDIEGLDEGEAVEDVEMVSEDIRWAEEENDDWIPWEPRPALFVGE
jgi:COMPASS component SWD1